MLPSRGMQSQQGAALMTTIVLALISLSVISGAALMLEQSRRSNLRRFTKQGQASNVARAGLQEAVSWFKTQQQQPVRQGNDPSFACEDAAFAPQYSSSPIDRETIDANFGLVKDFQIDRHRWGRFRIRRQPCPTDAGYTGYLPEAVHDYTRKRGKNEGSLSGEGVVWLLQSEGIVYRRQDYSKNADGVFLKGPEDAPNAVLERSQAAVEIQRLALNVERAPLSIYGDASGEVSQFNTRCKLNGDTNTYAGISYFGNAPTGSFAFSLPTGATQIQNLAQTMTPERVFSVSKNGMKGLADNVYQSVTEMPERLPFSITYLDGGTFVFSNTHPLTGAGVLFVDGDLTLQDNSNSLFSGLVYVTGHLRIGVNNSLSGAVIARRATCTPGSGGQSEIAYTHNFMNEVRLKLGTYRENNFTFIASRG